MISFNKFSTKIRTDPKYDNFFLYFAKGFIGDFLRSKDFFKRFRDENPDLEQRLRTGVSNAYTSDCTTKMLAGFEEDLYKAYTLMKGYGLSDNELLSISDE